MAAVLVVAPSADDETIGCAGTLLRHIAEGDEVHWLVVSAPQAAAAGEAVGTRSRETATSQIAAVAAAYPFARTHFLDLPEARIDALPPLDLVERIGAVMREVAPSTVYLPYRGDAHGDHRAVFDAASACTKPFRYPAVRRVLVYETLSETDQGLNPDRNGFRPDVFVDISAHLERKLELLAIYGSELGPHPFPRNQQALRALAIIRGAACHRHAAEAFMLLREIR